MIGTDLRFIQMRNRSEHRIDSPAHTCTGDSTCDRGLAQAWFGADIHAPALFTNGTLSLARAKASAQKPESAPTRSRVAVSLFRNMDWRCQLRIRTRQPDSISIRLRL